MVHMPQTGNLGLVGLAGFCYFHLYPGLSLAHRSHDQIPGLSLVPLSTPPERAPGGGWSSWHEGGALSGGPFRGTNERPGIWSCDLWANERPGNNFHWEGTDTRTNGHKDILTL